MIFQSALEDEWNSVAISTSNTPSKASKSTLGSASSGGTSSNTSIMTYNEALGYLRYDVVDDSSVVISVGG
jgi:hypothetical protein